MANEKFQAIEEVKNAMEGGGQPEVEAPQSVDPQIKTPDPTQYYELPVGEQKYKWSMDQIFPIPHDGATRQVPFSKLINGWRQVSHLETQQKKFKDQMSQYEQQMEKLKPLISSYGDIDTFISKVGEFDQWAHQNPDQWNRLLAMYQEKDKILNGESNPTNAEIARLNQTIKSMEDRLSRYDQFSKEAENKQLVEEVRGETESFKKEFPFIDLDTQDEDGVPLMSHILKFGSEGRYPTFRAAALDFKYPDGTPLLAKLLDTAKKDGRNAAVKGVVQDKKNGVVARSDKPFSGQSPQPSTLRSSGDPRQAMIEEIRSKFPQG